MTIGDRPDRRAMETRPARRKHSRPRPVENRESPNSPHSERPISNSADRSHPAKSQQAIATWRAGPGSRSAGSNQAHGIGPYNGRWLEPVSPSDSFKIATSAAMILQPGLRATESNPARSARSRPRRTDLTETRNPEAMVSRVQRWSRPRRNRSRRNRTTRATWRPTPGSRQAVDTQRNGGSPAEFV